MRTPLSFLSIATNACWLLLVSSLIPTSAILAAEDNQDNCPHDTRLPAGCENFIVASGNPPLNKRAGYIQIPTSPEADVIACLRGFAAEGMKMLVLGRESLRIAQAICTKFPCSPDSELSPLINPRGKKSLPLFIISDEAEENKNDKRGTFLQLRQIPCKTQKLQEKDNDCEMRPSGLSRCFR